MSQVNQLKNKARREEQRENWSRAIELYTQALDASRKGGEAFADLSLYNRIGDIYLRIGQKNTAVRYYEQAIERYADQDLHTSAIALCNKVLRIHPERSTIFLQLGRLHLATNLIADARAHYHKYAEAMREHGSEEAGLDALEELIERTGDSQTLDLWIAWLVEMPDREAALSRVEECRGSLISHGIGPDQVVRQVETGEPRDIERDPVASTEHDPLANAFLSMPEAPPSRARPAPEPESEPEEEGTAAEGDVDLVFPLIHGDLPYPVGATDLPRPKGESTPVRPAEALEERIPQEAAPAPEHPPGMSAASEARVPEPAPLELGSVQWDDEAEELLAELNRPIEDAWAEYASEAHEPPPVHRTGPEAETELEEELEQSLPRGGADPEADEQLDPVPASPESWAADIDLPYDDTPGVDAGSDAPTRDLEEVDDPPAATHAAPSDGPRSERSEDRVGPSSSGPDRPPSFEEAEIEIEADWGAEDFLAFTAEPPVLEEESPWRDEIEPAEIDALALDELDAVEQPAEEPGEGGDGVEATPEPVLGDIVPDDIETPESASDAGSLVFDEIEDGGAPEESEPNDGWLVELEGADVFAATPEGDLSSEVSEADEPVEAFEADEPVEAFDSDEPVEASELDEPAVAFELDDLAVVFDLDESAEETVVPPTFGSLDPEIETEPTVSESPRHGRGATTNGSAWLADEELDLEVPNVDAPGESSLDDLAPVAPAIEDTIVEEPVVEVEPVSDEPPVEELADEMSGPFAESRLTIEEDPEDAFRDWVRSASLGVLKRALPELENRSENEKALLVIERLSELESTDVEFRTRLVDTLEKLGRVAPAAEACVRLGVALEQLGRPGAARKAYERVLRIRPGHEDARAALEKLGDVDDDPHTEEVVAVVPTPYMPDHARSSGAVLDRPIRPAVLPSNGHSVPMDGVRPYSGVAGGAEASADFEQLLSEFRAELHTKPRGAGSSGRTELGASLKEMGRLDDAIRELQAAVREPSAPPLAYELLGEAFLEKGQARIAIRLLEKALGGLGHGDRELLGVLYQLGLAYEAVSEQTKALVCYERIFSVDIDYRDIQSRIMTCSA